MMLGPKGFFRAAALLGAAAVIIGAFGAHGLEGRVPAERIEVWETGVRYHFYHVLALFALAAATRGDEWTRFHTAAASSWVAGILVFSGSLYLLTITGQKWLGAITPLGGLAFIAGWLLLLPAARKSTLS